MQDAFELGKTPVHLGLGATASVQPAITGLAWYADYAERTAARSRPSR